MKRLSSRHSHPIICKQLKKPPSILPGCWFAASFIAICRGEKTRPLKLSAPRLQFSAQRIVYGMKAESTNGIENVVFQLIMNTIPGWYIDTNIYEYICNLYEMKPRESLIQPPAPHTRCSNRAGVRWWNTNILAEQFGSEKQVTGDNISKTYWPANTTRAHIIALVGMMVRICGGRVLSLSHICVDSVMQARQGRWSTSRTSSSLLPSVRSPGRYLDSLITWNLDLRASTFLYFAIHIFIYAFMFSYAFGLTIYTMIYYCFMCFLLHLQ